MHRRLLGAITAALLALSLVALVPTAQATEDDSNGSDEEFLDPRSGCEQNLADCGFPVLIPGHIRLFATFLPIRPTQQARAHYRRLLPPGFSMPERPGFFVSFADYHVGADVGPGSRAVPQLAEQLGQAPAGTAWREAGLHMIARYTTEQGVTADGIFELAFATDGLVGYLGRPSYPKYYADVTFETNENGLPARLSGPDSVWHSAALVHGPTTNGRAEPTSAGTFTPADVALPWWVTEGLGPDWRLAPNNRDGGGTHQGPDVLQLRVTYQGATPLAWIGGRNLGAAEIPGLTGQPQWVPGLVDISLDPRLHRYDEQSPEPIPDELWHNIDLRRIVDVVQTQPGARIDGQLMLHALEDRRVGPGGCAWDGSCREPLQYRPAPEDQAPAWSNSPVGFLDGVACQTGSTPAGDGSCEFTARTPGGAYLSGFVSATTGSFEIAATEAGCRIWAYDRAATGSFGLVYQEPSGDVFRASGAGIGTLVFEDGCTYRLTVSSDGAGAVWAGQTN